MHALVTGASSGIGRALAVELSRRGYKLSVVARREGALRALAEEVSSTVEAIVADLSDPGRVQSVVDSARAALGPVDLLVNNAGVQIVQRTHTVEPEAAERLFRLNVFTPMRLTRAVLPEMLDRGSGTIVDIASLAALAPTPAMYHYSASKAALAAASESLRGELRGTGVHVVTVYPGPVHTDMAQTAVAKYDEAGAKEIAKMPTGTTDVLATKIANAVKNRKARIIYPGVYGVVRQFPGTTRYVMDRRSPLPKS